MLFGSRSGLAPAPVPTAEPVTPLPVVPPVCAPVEPAPAPAVALRSSTGASVVGVLEQPASPTAAINAIQRYLCMPPPAGKIGRAGRPARWNDEPFMTAGTAPTRA